MEKKKETKEVAKVDFWRNHLKAFRESGFTIAEYCELEDLAKSTFGYWKRKLEGEEKGPTHFVEVNIPERRAGQLIHIRLKKGTELGIAPGTDIRYIGDLVKAIEES